MRARSRGRARTHRERGPRLSASAGLDRAENGRRQQPALIGQTNGELPVLELVARFAERRSDRTSPRGFDGLARRSAADAPALPLLRRKWIPARQQPQVARAGRSGQGDRAHVVSSVPRRLTEQAALDRAEHPGAERGTARQLDAPLDSLGVDPAGRLARDREACEERRRVDASASERGSKRSESRDDVPSDRS